MSVNSVGTVNANYIQHLQERKNRGVALGLMGAGTTTLAYAAEKCGSTIAKKNPWLTLACAAVGLLGTIFGFGGAAKAQNEINNHLVQQKQFVA